MKHLFLLSGAAVVFTIAGTLPSFANDMAGEFSANVALATQYSFRGVDCPPSEPMRQNRGLA